MSGVIKVKFHTSQSGNCEDIFRGIEDTSKYYSRSTSGKWGTSNKWSGGYERSADVGEDVKFLIHSKSGNLLFTESAHQVDNKNYPFSWRIGENLLSDLTAKHSLINHKQWREVLKEKHSELGSKEYLDNWVYATHILLDSQIEQSIEFYGEKYDVVVEKLKHKECNLKWIQVFLKPNKYNEVQYLYGYRYFDSLS